MQIKLDTSSFRYFPYPSDGKGNNGGFDLIKNPERIDDITEFQKFPDLRRFVVWLNFQSKNFKTFGCDGDWDDDIFNSYIEFGFRDTQRAGQTDLYQKMFDNFEGWLGQKCSDTQVSAICSWVSPEMAQIYDGETASVFGYKIALWVGGQSKEVVAELFDTFFGYLKTHEREYESVV